MATLPALAKKLRAPNVTPSGLRKTMARLSRAQTASPDREHWDVESPYAPLGLKSIQEHVSGYFELNFV